VPSWAPGDTGGPGAPAAGGGGGGGPSTGRGGGAAPAPGGSGGRGGIPIDFRRGKTAKKLLEIEWAYPVYKPVTPSTPTAGGTTTAVEAERALPLAQAYELVADGDRRPLLVLRECDRCKGTDHALLSRTLDNEQTVLLTHWFRCVKLPTNVMNDVHPFHKLFERTKPGERVPHLFFADPDGQNRKELPGDQPQSVLWDTMLGYLDRCYVEDAKAAVKELRQVLGQYDKLDAQEQEVKARIDLEIEKNGPKSPKVVKLEGDLDKLAKKRATLGARERELRDLALKAMAATPASPEPAAGAGAAR
jgi:hypothetical protein